eukprot:jgi/Ulvmu1/8478/UM044_0011.1
MHRALVRRVNSALSAFSKLSAAHPVAVQSVAGAMTWSIGNIVTQSQSKGQDDEIDWKDVAIYASYGPLLSNLGHTWYRHLHVFTNRTLRMTTWQMVSTKLAADAFVFGPLHVTALLTWTHFWQKKPLNELPATYRAQFFAMVGAEAVIWTPVQYINFTMLPVQHQQMFVNVVAIIEAAVLSWLADTLGVEHGHEAKEATPATLEAHH